MEADDELIRKLAKRKPRPRRPGFVDWSDLGAKEEGKLDEIWDKLGEERERGQEQDDSAA